MTPGHGRVTEKESVPTLVPNTPNSRVRTFTPEFTLHRDARTVYDTSRRTKRALSMGLILRSSVSYKGRRGLFSFEK
jgi:hypothetical protein